METPKELPSIRNITVSGRIGSGQTTLATKLAQCLGWQLLEGGELFRKFHEEAMNDTNELDVKNRPDDFDTQYEEQIKKILQEEQHNVVQSHLAGFDAQGIEGVFKILVTCEDEEGNDKTDIRIDRLVNRRKLSVEDAKEQVIVREAGNMEKWKRLYGENDPNWVYWDKKYYDLVINTYSHNQDETLRIALEALGVKN